MTGSIRTEVDGTVAEVYFDRGAHNAVSAAMVGELQDALRAIAADDGVQLVVLTGAGRAFCPGADLAGAESAAGEEFDAADYGATALLHDMPQVTVAAINGACAGAGLAWAAACDLRVASDRARFNVAFLRVGVAGDMGGAWTLQRALGAARARELFFLADKFDAAEALRIGLVSRVLAGEDFLPQVRELLEPLATAPAEVLRLTKANFLAADRMSLADYVALETHRHLDLFRGAKGGRTRASLAAQARRVSGRAEPPRG